MVDDATERRELRTESQTYRVRKVGTNKMGQNEAEIPCVFI